MTPVEIENAVTDLAAKPFSPAEFPFDFLAAFGLKDVTLAKLRKDKSKSDVPAAVLQPKLAHLLVTATGETHDGLRRLKESPATEKQKARFLVATDGHVLSAEDRLTGEALETDLAKLPEHLGFLFPLGGVAVVPEIRDNPIDVRATARLNRLYVELLKTNPAWDTAEKRAEMDTFLARLIFLFFAEDTHILRDALFTSTVRQFTQADGSDVHLVLRGLFRAMNLPLGGRGAMSRSPRRHGFYS